MKDVYSISTLGDRFQLVRCKPLFYNHSLTPGNIKHFYAQSPGAKLVQTHKTPKQGGKESHRGVAREQSHINDQRVTYSEGR